MFKSFSVCVRVCLCQLANAHRTHYAQIEVKHIALLLEWTYLCSFKSSSNCEIFVTIFRWSFRNEFNSLRIFACSLSFFDDSPAMFFFCSVCAAIFKWFCFAVDCLYQINEPNEQKRQQQQQQWNLSIQNGEQVKWNEHTQREIGKFYDQIADGVYWFTVCRCLLY